MANPNTLEIPTVVIPPKFVPELKKLPDTVLGFQEATDEVGRIPPVSLPKVADGLVSLRPSTTSISISQLIPQFWRTQSKHR